MFDNKRGPERLFRAIPGLDDFAVLGKVWHEATRGGVYDTVVFDGPATGHLRLNLGVPRAILETTTAGPLAKEARAICDTFENAAASAAVLVSLPEAWPLTELSELADALRDEIGIALGALVINKRWPEPARRLGPPPRDASEPVEAVYRTYEAAWLRAREQGEAIAEWRDGMAGGSPATLELPWRARGLDRFEKLQRLRAAVLGGHS